MFVLEVEVSYEISCYGHKAIPDRQNAAGGYPLSDFVREYPIRRRRDQERVNLATTSNWSYNL